MSLSREACRRSGDVVGNLTQCTARAILHIARRYDFSREILSPGFGPTRAIHGPTSFMDKIAVTAASGLHARMEALDLVANNLANATTGGFKLDREFYSVFAAAEDSSEGSSGSHLPLIQKQWTDFSQGVLQPTGNPLDLALSGKGFFVANGPSGPLYTRNGSFQLSSSGVLTTTEGHAVRGVGGTPIQSKSQAPFEIAPDGSVNQGGQKLGQLEVVDFQDRSLLRKTGNSYFTVPNPKVAPIPATGAIVEQGKVENSNVAPAESAVRLVGIMRQFEMLQKAVLVTTDMSKKAIEE